MGNHDFYGPKKTVDTTKKFTVVTQFITSDGKSTGEFSEMRRLYVQDGKVIKNIKAKMSGLEKFDSLTKDYCELAKPLFGSKFGDKGGFSSMSGSMERGMVLAMSLWDDQSDADMLWLDGNYPVGESTSKPGIVRGTCTAEESKAAKVEATHPDASVEFSNIRVGEIDSTYDTKASPASKTPGSTTTNTKKVPEACKV